MVKAEALHGAWDLVSWRRIEADGGETHPFTEGASGQILYEPGGRLAVFLMRPDWATGDGADGFVAYGGRFAVEGGDVHHIVAFASRKAMVGTLQVRRATITGDTLSLEAPAVDDSGARHRLEWRRAAGV